MSALEVEPDHDWRDYARCHGDGDLFFGPSHYEKKPDRLRREQQAKRVCRGCAVRDECREYALAAREVAGVWGGMTPRERVTALARRGTDVRAMGRDMGLHQNVVAQLKDAL